MDAYLLTNGGDFDADPWRRLRELAEQGPGFQVVTIPDRPGMKPEEVVRTFFEVLNAPGSEAAAECLDQEYNSEVAPCRRKWQNCVYHGKTGG